MPARYVALRGIWCRITARQRPQVEFPAMDGLDRAILSQLQEYGRLAKGELAERPRRSPPAPRRRGRNAEAAGEIAGYHASIDPAAVGRGFQVTVHVTLMLRN